MDKETKKEYPIFFKYQKEKELKKLKKCSKCKKYFPRTSEYFHKSSLMTDGFVYTCKSCKKKWDKDYHKYRRYKLTKEEYDGILKNQNNLCGICGIILKDDYNTHVDHNHQTGKIRGLLCVGCNTGLGNFKENPFILIKAIKYIEKYKKKKN